MTAAHAALDHRKMLRDIKSEAEGFAKSLKIAHDAGYQINVNFDYSGNVQKFDVKQLVAIDIDADPPKTN